MKTKLSLSFIIWFIFFLEIIIVSPVNAVIKIMPLGNSITQGYIYGVDEIYQVSYRKALYDLLAADGYDVDFVGTLNSGSAVFGNVDLAYHEGHPGWTADEIVNGDGWPYEPGAGKLEDWLIYAQPDIVLLHIGTNDLYWDPQDPDGVKDEVSQILDEIDAYSVDIPVILALIINRLDYNCSYPPNNVTTFNDLLSAMANDRVTNPANPAYPDKIEIVDMECGADIDYLSYTLGGDMYDPDGELHPYSTGYEKMAEAWFSGLKAILPVLYYVSPEGFDSNSCLFPGTPCKTIQHVIDVASEIAIIKIAEGTYVEDVVMDLSKEITLQGGWDATFTTRQGDSTIHGKVTLSNQKLIFDKVLIK